jgi:hypothetical protein
MTSLTPICAFVAFAALAPFAGALAGRVRAGAVRKLLGLPAPRRRRAWRLAATTLAFGLLGLAAAQPALTHESKTRVRNDVAALFVVDTSRSMAASATASSPTRLDRAVLAAVRLRAAIADVPSGVATLTDRVLPDLLPVADAPGFDGVVERAVAIESPPPRGSGVRVTTYAALEDIPSGNYFEPNIARRVVVLLTDGESNPVDPGEISRSLGPVRGYRLVALRFWHAGESVYGADGKPETGYRPDPTGRAILDGLAQAAGGRAFEERDVASAAAYLKQVVGSGRTTTSAAITRSREPLAPFVALPALLLLLLALVPFPARRTGIQSVA